MIGRAFSARATIRRAALESGLLAFALVLPLVAILRPALEPGLVDAGEAAGYRPASLGIGLAYAGLFGGLLGALRLRRATGGAWRPLWRELAAGAVLVLALWAGALLAHVVGALWTAGGSPAGTDDLALTFRALGWAGTSAAQAALVYPLYRAAVLAWPAWDRRRRTRLLWALTHAQLVGSLALAAGVAVLLTAVGAGRFGPPLGPEALPDDAGFAVAFLAWLTTRLLPTLTDLLVLGVAVGVVLLPLAVLVSLPVLRRTTRRLEALAAAAGALRAGDLATRVPVAGEDEVGRLQADFNAMAADLERTLRDLQAERDRVAGLLEAQRQLAASVSHELRTPVATVRGYLEAALRSDRDAGLAGSPAGSGQALRADLETMAREVARLQRLIEDLFALSRAEVGRLDLRLAPTDAGEVVRRLVETTAPLAWRQRRVEVLAEVAPDLPPARADAARLEQVVSNLLGNAVRHTPPGGLVVAAVRAEPDALRIEVRDTGEGIPAEDLSHVFERFYRGSRTSAERSDAERSEGAGLGLALVKELTEAMGGSVEAASLPGEGSCFTVRLPRT